MKRQVAGEFLGTALMVSVGCGSVAWGASHVAVSLTFGAVVTMAILLFGAWSGAHINPAVSVAFWRDGQLEGRLLPAYMLAQYAGALFGASLVAGAAPTSVVPSMTLATGFSVEITITLALMASILFIVQRTSSRPVVAVWVGATVALLAFLAGFVAFGSPPGLILEGLGPFQECFSSLRPSFFQCLERLRACFSHTRRICKNLGKT